MLADHAKTSDLSARENENISDQQADGADK
jgi:hypothetical protein